MTASLRDVKRQQAAEEIVAAAIDLFERQGYEQTTIAQVAAAAHQSERTVFRHFGAKEDLLFGDVDEHLELLRRDILDRLADGTPAWTAVAAAAIGLVRTIHDGPSSTWRRVLLWQREPALHARWVHYLDVWESAIADLLLARAGDDPDAVTTARVIAASSQAAVRIALSSAAAEDDPAAYLEQVLARFGRGLAGTDHDSTTPRDAQSRRPAVRSKGARS